jgi:hypothetical protein
MNVPDRLHDLWISGKPVNFVEDEDPGLFMEEFTN